MLPSSPTSRPAATYAASSPRSPPRWSSPAKPEPPRFGDTTGWAEGWTKEFDHWADEVVERMDVDSAMNFLDVAPAAHLAHLRTEHFAPLFVSLGSASESKLNGRSTIEGYWYGLSRHLS